MNTKAGSQELISV